MLLGNVFFSQLFGHFMQPNAILVSPDVAYYAAAAVMLISLVLFLRADRKTV
jgi:MFS transporter, DHA1 family, tetracycline resistance protein